MLLEQERGMLQREVGRGLHCLLWVAAMSAALAEGASAGGGTAREQEPGDACWSATTAGLVGARGTGMATEAGAGSERRAGTWSWWDCDSRRSSVAAASNEPEVGDLRLRVSIDRKKVCGGEL